MRGSASRTARKLFEKSFLDLQKLLKMGITKPRPSGEVAAVGLTERAIICKERCEALPRAPQGNFWKSSLDPQNFRILV